MKLLTTFLILSLSIILSPKLSSQTCLPDGITFGIQAGIDLFPSNYPGCTVILGDILIEEMDTDISNVDSLIYLTEVQGDVIIGGEYGTPYFGNFIGFENLTEIGGDFEISGNYDLYSLTGLENLTTIGGQLSISGNPFLSNLQGLDNLTSVESVSIVGNSSLTSLTGIDSIDYSLLTSLTISYNDALTMCNVYSVCNYINSEDPTVTIYNNETGCDSQTQVQEQCVTSINDFSSNDIDMILYPNPANSNFTITLENGMIKEIWVIDSSGRRLFTEKDINQSQITIDKLPVGAYILKIIDDNGRISINKIISSL